MLRFIITVIFVVLFLILSMPLMLIEWIIGKFNRSERPQLPCDRQLGVPHGRASKRRETDDPR